MSDRKQDCVCFYLDKIKVVGKAGCCQNKKYDLIKNLFFLNHGFVQPCLQIITIEHFKGFPSVFHNSEIFHSNINSD